jgi:hypothetical protein
VGFSAGDVSFEAFDRGFDGVAGSAGVTETSVGGAEREAPQPILCSFNATPRTRVIDHLCGGD